MAKLLQIKIPTPCHEDWNKMSPLDKGRFCGSCQKTVVDFSNMSDRQLAEFFKKPSTGSVCGRFMTDQLDRPMEIPRKRIPWLKYFFQFVIPAFLLSLKSSYARAQTGVLLQNPSNGIYSKGIEKDTVIMEEVVVVAKPPGVKPKDIYSSGLVKARSLTELTGKVMGPVIAQPAQNTSNLLKRDLSKPTGSKRTVSGVVMDDKGELVPGVTISVKGLKQYKVTDGVGEFSIELKTGDIIVASSADIETTEIIVDKKSKVWIEVKRANVPPVIVGIFYFEPNKELLDVPLMKEISGDNASKTIVVSPNPVSPGCITTISGKGLKDGEYVADFMLPSGQLLDRQDIRVRNGKQANVEIPTVAAGTYLVVLSNKKTGKKFTGKVIVR